MKSIVYFFLFAAAFFIHACSSMTGSISSLPSGSKKIFQTSEIEKTISLVQSKNHHLKTFKGIGSIALSNAGGTQHFRIAWSGSKPGKLRAVILVAGQPAETFATDGEFLYLSSHSLRHSFIKKRTTDASLKKLLLIPIKTSDIIKLLTGSVPIYAYDDARLESNESENEYVLTLKKRWYGVVEKIFFDKTMETIYKIETFDSWGKLVYSAEMSRMQTINKYQIPFAISITNDKNVSVKLTMDRYWADIQVSPSMFVLVPPEEK